MKNIRCRNCKNLRNNWCEKVIDSPDPDVVRDCQYFATMTNADRIRAMANMELFWGFFCAGMIWLTGFVLGYLAGYRRRRKDREADHE